MCGSVKGNIFYAIKGNTELKQEVAYLTACFEKTKLGEKMIEEDLSRAEESPTKSTHRLGIGFESMRTKVGRVLLSSFLALATIKRRRQSNQQKLTTHPTQSHSSMQREK
jgi:hypothetical protein